MNATATLFGGRNRSRTWPPICAIGFPSTTRPGEARELLPVNESDEFEVLQLRRLAGSLYTSSKVPVAAAAYGASQVGKSLFMGCVLRPQSENYCPIGGDETLGEPA